MSDRRKKRTTDQVAGAQAVLCAVVIGLSLNLCSPTGRADASEPKPAPAKVLPSSRFFGQAALGYAAAEQCPEIIAKLFCYCGCDGKEFSHTSLLDCFTCDHGADCQICTDEALIAAQMKKQGKSIPEIQKVIDDRYEKEYPFEQPTPAYKNYREHVRGSKLGADPVNSAPVQIAKLKPGAKAGNCCGGHNK